MVMGKLHYGDVKVTEAGMLGQDQLQILLWILSRICKYIAEAPDQKQG